jgi:hypothetical protein
MALTPIEVNITLDVYDHDGPKPAIKSIALDDNTRYVFARFTNHGAVYDIGSDASVELIVIRPDIVGVEIKGQSRSYDIGTADDAIVAAYGAYAELDQPAIAILGALLGQFIITVGTQRLTSQIFTIDNGRSLAAETTEWADKYQGYDLKEFAKRIETAEDKVTNMCKIITTGTTLAITTTQEA